MKWVAKRQEGRVVVIKLARKTDWDTHSVIVRGKMFFKQKNVKDGHLLEALRSKTKSLVDLYNEVPELSNVIVLNINWAKIPHRSIYDIKMMEDSAQRDRSTIPISNEYTVFMGSIRGWNSSYYYQCAEKTPNTWIAVTEDAGVILLIVIKIDIMKALQDIVLL